MNPKMQTSIATYNATAGKLASTYNSLNPTDVHPHLESIFPTPDATRQLNALDLGCGSGRDAFWLASRGYQVVAIDAAPNMIAEALAHKSHPDILYLVDAMPSIPAVRSLDLKYDAILLSAVWMHLDHDERRSLVKTMREISTENSVSYITLRHGTSPEDRPMLPVSLDEIDRLSKEFGFAWEEIAAVEDKLNRQDVHWEYAALRPL